MGKPFNFYSRFESGHRHDYINFTKSSLGGDRTKLPYGFLSSKPLLFLMVEECFILYCTIAFLRSLIGFTTIGFVFRAKDCIASQKIEHKIKVALLKAFKKIKKIHSISIVPFYTFAGLSEICDDWLYDFQFWDIEFLENTLDKSIIEKYVLSIKKQAKGRKVVCAIGKQDRSKGFDVFSSLYIENKFIQDNFYFVSGGKISEISDTQVKLFSDSGALVINERISNEQLVALYKSADLIWACYSPCYDQSSGVLGRAIQYNLPVIVRENSVVEFILSELQYENVLIEHLNALPDKTKIYEMKKSPTNKTIKSKNKFFDLIN